MDEDDDDEAEEWYGSTENGDEDENEDGAVLGEDEMMIWCGDSSCLVCATFYECGSYLSTYLLPAIQSFRLLRLNPAIVATNMFPS